MKWDWAYCKCGQKIEFPQGHIFSKFFGVLCGNCLAKFEKTKEEKEANEKACQEYVNLIMKVDFQERFDKMMKEIRL